MLRYYIQLLRGNEIVFFVANFMAGVLLTERSESTFLRVKIIEKALKTSYNVIIFAFIIN